MCSRADPRPLFLLVLTAFVIGAQAQPGPASTSGEGGYEAIDIRLRVRTRPLSDGRLPEKPPTLQVQNPFGSIRIAILNTDEITVRAKLNGRPAAAADVAVGQSEGLFQVAANPADKRPIDLDIGAPYGLIVEAATTDGAIDYTGFGIADFQTDYGAISMTFPAAATRFELLAVERPDTFDGTARLTRPGGAWRAADRLDRRRLTYGQFTLRSQRPRSITLRDAPEILWESPIKMPWQAEDLLPRLFHRSTDAGLKSRREPERTAKDESSGADFSSEVRLVQLDVSVTDAGGSPVVGLGPGDFQVEEDGKAQRLVDVSNVDAPFNLILLLDCSSSTRADRPAIQKAALSFVDVAREDDRLGIYALGETFFQALVHLTDDRDRARRGVAAIERFGGATPLYDSMVLAYAEELAALPRQRNALVILSDGDDNRLVRVDSKLAYGRTPSRKERSLLEPSRVSFEQLRQAAEEMDTLIYPIVLDPASGAAKTDPLLVERGQTWRAVIRQQAEALAEATGGKPFYASSLEDLDEVYARVAQELRSIYTLSYRPSNATFEGEWRRVRVRTTKADAIVRTRTGYFAY